MLPSGLVFAGRFHLLRQIARGGRATVYEAEQRRFIAMELIRGITLWQLINAHRARRLPIPGEIAAYCASRICRALDFAHHFTDPQGHRLDIVHRDVSPANVMLTWDGHVKLADFGIAKARTMADPAADGRPLLGKKHYMSPEQLLGQPVTGTADVFATGVVLFELFALRSL
jgi:serine/threonine-protein kinase